MYNEMNREAHYFEILIKLFDVYLERGNIQRACETLERLVDIDPYDYRNQQRFELLKGKADQVFLQRISGRLARSGQAAATTQERNAQPAAGAAPAVQIGGDESKQPQA